MSVIQLSISAPLILDLIYDSDILQFCCLFTGIAKKCTYTHGINMLPCANTANTNTN